MRSEKNVMTVLVAALALAASAMSLGNGFALDDVPIILQNPRVHSLADAWQLLGQTYWPPDYGSSLYRPLTSIAFAIQWAIGGGSPLAFHIVSVALYVAVCVLLLRLARGIMEPRAAAIGAAVFAVHPIHVEAVANVVGQAELWVALIMVGALSYYMKRRTAGRVGPREMGALSAMYATSLMFKENAIVLPALILAAEAILPDARVPDSRTRIRRAIPLLAAMTVVAVTFVVLRAAVIGKVTGGSTATVLAGQDFPTRLFTMLRVIPEWIRLFVWPAQLSADYSPPRISTATSFDLSMAPALVVIAAVVAIAIRLRRSHPPAALAVAFAGITLLIPSNLVVVTGFALAERALFLASAGVCLIMGLAVAALVARTRTVAGRRLIVAAAAAVLVAGVIRSSVRSVIWKNNETLFRQTVKDVPSSYRAHMSLGELLTDQGRTEEGLRELILAVRFSRQEDFFVRWFAADRFHAAGRLRTAVKLYEEALAIKPSDEKSKYGVMMARAALAEADSTRTLAD